MSLWVVTAVIINNPSFLDRIVCNSLTEYFLLRAFLGKFMLSCYAGNFTYPVYDCGYIVYACQPANELQCSVQLVQEGSSLVAAIHAGLCLGLCSWVPIPSQGYLAPALFPCSTQRLFLTRLKNKLLFILQVIKQLGHRSGKEDGFGIATTCS